VKWIWLVAAACGGASEQQPPPRPPAPPPAIAPTTCADVGVILRGKVTSNDDDAGPAREAAIATSCHDDHWPAAVIACIGESRTPQSCVDKLSPMLAASYEARLAEWATRYTETSDVDGPDAETPCGVVGDVVVRLSDDVSVERDWVLDARKRLVEAECGGWSELTKQCMIADPPPSDLASCVPGDANLMLHAKLAAIDARAAAMSVAKQQPTTITCAKVAAAYYGDAEWKGKLAGATPKAHKKAIVGSRAAMQRACTDGAWNDTLRACLATGGAATCFAGTSVPAADWGFPASATVVRALPPACVEFERLAQHIDGCTSVQPEVHDVVARVRQLLEEQARSDPDGVGAACQAAIEQMSELSTCS
jgi:hypothetical protein